MADMKKLLEEYEHKRPEIVFEWKDAETEAEGWVVIDSLRGGAAGGGTRMRVGVDKREVESLAKTMGIKFTVSGPQIGGAKSGINFDPKDPRKHGVLERWYKAVSPLLKNYYGTGGDMNVDEVHEVIPVTSRYGILHPQEGIVNGHFNVDSEQRQQKVKQLQTIVSKVLDNADYSPSLEKKYTVSDMITGFGVAESVRHFYELKNKSLSGKRVIIQGWGNVASAAAYYIAKEGGKIAGIIDKDGGLIYDEPIGFEATKALFLNKKGNQLHSPDMLSFDEVDKKIWDVEAEVFLPCAGSRLITKDHIDRLIAGGLEVISSGANVPFADKEIFFGPIADYSDDRVSVIPDFIANCGMARVFAYCMESRQASLDDHAIFSDTSQVIRKALKEVFNVNSNDTKIAKAAFEIALKKLV